MFSKFRMRTTVYQLAVIGAVLFVVFAFSCVYNYERLIDNVSSGLDGLEQEGVYFGDQKKDSIGRNEMIIRVYADGRLKLSNIAFYDEETILNLISVAKDDRARITLKGNKIAYSLKKNGGDIFYTLYLYDYTDEYNLFIVNLITTLLTGVAVLTVVSFFMFRFTARNLAPIENAMEKQKELVANASHELKTPLTIINTNLAILNSSSDEFTEEQRKWLAGIGTQVQRMSAMINEMLALARFEAVREKAQTKINLSEIVETVVLETEALAFEKNIIMDSSVEAGICVTAGKDDMEKLIYILVENALKYTPSGGKITVRLGMERHKVVLKVRNTGEGIPREKMTKLFDRFYRAEESHTDSGSFGLGLSIAKAIVDAARGTIGVDSKEGEYTEFIIML